MEKGLLHKQIMDFFVRNFDVRQDKEDELDTIESIKKGVEFKGTNLWVLIFATFVASLGLNTNSTAVIIGAMLISPLMGPIMGFGLGLGISDFELIKRSFRNFATATIFSVITSTLYFLISPISEAQSELLARTQPTVYDVLIAFFGGLAGIVASSTKSKGNVIPGVAIATALMPPLCTAGFGLASGNLYYFFGAFYLDLFRKDYYQRKGSLSLLFTLIVFYSVITAFMVTHNIFNVYIIPYAMLPIIIRVFLDSRTAFLTHVITILICSISLRFPHEFILTQLAAGLVAIFSLRELSQRSQLFRTALLVILTYAAIYFAFELMTENGLSTDFSKLNIRMYTYFIINGILLLFTYPLLFLLEKTFGFTSNVTLVELSNINNDLLRQMSETVPGTFQHSMQVANLAAEAAIRIGAKSQLVRTGALYHDIGKMENPAFFTENQSGGVNPHKNLNYEQSAQVVISHVTDGLKLADKHNLPKAVKDFISTHHGRGKTKYFYISWKNEHPDEEPNEELFTYPGPNPFTKEQAILMMADAVEAASRSLPEYTEETISNLVDKIIDSQVTEGYFKECPITFKDIATVKAVFKEKLKIAYHTRISYPELKK